MALSLRAAQLRAPPLAPSFAAPARAAAPRAALVVRADQTLIGKVVSTATAKTVVVAVQRQVAHPKYLKRVLTTKKYMAHDETEVCGNGDVVKLTSCRPLSARKRFTVAEVLKKAFVEVSLPLPGETQ